MIPSDRVAGFPLEVRQLLKSYDLGQLRWSDRGHRWAIVREVLTRGGITARTWLPTMLSAAEVRALVVDLEGAGLNEPQRARLRAELGISLDELPLRPYLGFTRCHAKSAD